MCVCVSYTLYYVCYVMLFGLVHIHVYMLCDLYTCFAPSNTPRNVSQAWPNNHPKKQLPQHLRK